jgi:hypothetical protein
VVAQKNNGHDVDEAPRDHLRETQQKGTFIVDFILGVILALFVGTAIAALLFIPALMIAFAPMNGATASSIGTLFIIVAFFIYIPITIKVGQNDHAGRSAGMMVTALVAVAVALNWLHMIENRATLARRNTPSLMSEVMKPEPPSTLSDSDLSMASGIGPPYPDAERDNARRWLMTSANIQKPLELKVAYAVMRRGGTAQWRETMDVIWALPPDRHAAIMLNVYRVYDNQNISTKDTKIFIEMVKYVPLAGLYNYIRLFWPYSAGKEIKEQLVTALRERIAATTSQEDADRTRKILNTAVLSEK